MSYEYHEGERHPIKTWTKGVQIEDESPAAYKDISAVMAAQADLIEVVHRLRQIVNVKG